MTDYSPIRIKVKNEFIGIVEYGGRGCCHARLMRRATFGVTLPGPLPEVVVRNWGALITLMRAMPIYAFKPQVRSLALAVAGASKLIFIALVP